MDNERAVTVFSILVSKIAVLSGLVEAMESELTSESLQRVLDKAPQIAEMRGKQLTEEIKNALGISETTGGD